MGFMIPTNFFATLAPATVLPSDLPNLKLWYKADAMVGNGDATSDGDAVQKWTDSASGNNWPLYDQGNAAKRPTYKTGQINSLPSVNFDGSSDELRTGSSGGGGLSVTWGSDTVTLFAVLQDNSPNPTAGVGVNWAAADDGGGFPMFLLQRYNTATTGRWRGLSTTPTYFDATATVSNGTTTGDWHVITAICRSGDVQIYVDGVASGTTTRTGTNQNKSTPLWLGGIFGGSFTVIKMAELYVFTDAKSDANRHSQESYLSAKYGISVSVQ